MRIFDNGGKTFDRYTVIIDGDVYGMSGNAQSVSGFNQYCCRESEVEYLNLGKEVRFEKLPIEVQRAIREREE